MKQSLQRRYATGELGLPSSPPGTIRTLFCFADVRGTTPACWIAIKLKDGTLRNKWTQAYQTPLLLHHGRVDVARAKRDASARHLKDN